MKFQAILVLSLAYAVSAQYNYYARPLSYGQQAMPAEMQQPSAPPMQAMPVMPEPVTMAPSYAAYSSSAPKAQAPERQLTREENPCSEEVLRSPEIQAFRDPLDRTSYIVCTELDVFVRMPCATGTFFDTTIRHCVPEGWVAPVCPVGMCKNNADCIIDEIKNEYKCLCRIGFTGLLCETNIDECAMEGNGYCAGQNGQCVDQINAYYCDFGAKIGLTQETAIEKPCSLMDLSLEKQFFKIEAPMDNVYLQCTGENRWLVSKCAEMLFWNQELRTCTIEVPIKKTGVCLTYPCKNDGSCMDLGNFNFQCTCKEGYTGALCEEVIDFCLPMPCGAGRCVSHPGGYNCVCQGNVVDKSCDQMIQNPCSKPLDYFSHALDFTKYISCGLEGFAFVKSCAAGTYWDDSIKTCMAEEVSAPIVKAPKMSIFDGSSRAPMTPAPVSSSYGQQQQQMPTQTMTPVRQEYTPAPPTQTPPPQTPPPQVRQPYSPMTPPTMTPPPQVRQPYAPQTPPMTPPPQVRQPYKPQMPMGRPTMTRPQMPMRPATKAY